MRIAEKKASEFGERLIGWYEINGRRDLPWRTSHQSPSPYEILMSEFMLQQTTAKQVEAVYPFFIDKFPAPKSLAEAKLESVQQIVGELGLKYRAERMKKTAEKIVAEHSGKVPKEKTDLLSFPGVGEYIANSTLCYAFGKDVPIIDTNAGRILKRVLDLQIEGRMRQCTMLWDKAEKLLPKNQPIKYNYGLLDLGAFICKKQSPKCRECPVEGLCEFAGKNLSQ